MATISTRFKKYLSLIAMTASTCILVACGGGSSSPADTTPPSVSAFSVKNGTAITAGSDASYAVSGNVGSTQEYTITFSEKLDATSYSVKMLDSNNAQVALPIGMTAALTANDATNLSYTLTITTSGSFVFDAGQPSKAVKLQMSVADVATNTAKVNITETVNHVDTAGVATITGPAQSVSGPITLNLSASDVDGIATWSVTYTRFRIDGTQILTDFSGTPITPPVIVQSGTASVPSSINMSIGGAAGQTVVFTFEIVDIYGVKSSNSWTVTKI